ncbi:MAG: MIP/aquaporin family protein [Bacteroidota bacterium]
MKELFIAELMGTFFLILLGNGVVSNVVLKGTKGHGAGYFAITAAWCFAVFVGCNVAIGLGSNGELNPATVVAGMVNGTYSGMEALVYIAGEFSGAMLGALVVYIFYKNHFDLSSDAPSDQIACFCNSPAIKNTPINLFGEVVATFVLMYVAMSFTIPNTAGSFAIIPVATLVWAIGLSLGGTTGYAINPARDLGPRIVHALIPIKGKGNSNWSYAWIPVVGPIAGAVSAALLFNLLH